MVKPVKLLTEFVAADYRILPWPAINTFISYPMINQHHFTEKRHLGYLR